MRDGESVLRVSWSFVSILVGPAAVPVRAQGTLVNSVHAGPSESLASCLHGLRVQAPLQCLSDSPNGLLIFSFTCV